MRKQQFSIFCSGLKQAKTACFNPKCYGQSLTCQDPVCKCQSTHNKCNLNIPVSSFHQTLKSQGEKTKPLYTLLSQWCRKQIKTLTSFVDQISILLDNCEITLEEEEKDVYQALKNKKSKEITSLKVSKIISKCLYQSQKEEKDENIIFTKHLNVIEEDIKEIYKSVRKLMSNMDSIKFGFCPDLCHTNLILSNNTIQNKNLSQNDKWSFALITPSIQSLQIDQKHRLVIKKVEQKLNNIVFGLCYSEVMKSKQLISDGSTESLRVLGYLLLSHNGRTFSKTGRNDTNIKCIKQGEILEIQINRHKTLVTFTNLSTKEFTSINLEIRNEEPLFLCCGLMGNAEIQYLGIYHNE